MSASVIVGSVAVVLILLSVAVRVWIRRRTGYVVLPDGRKIWLSKYL